MLYNKKPLVVNTELAEDIGLEKSIILQQIHYWLEQKKNYNDGRYWVYNTYEDWHKQFPFFGVRSIKRYILDLEKQGIIITGNYNKMKIDKTKWYTINYDHKLFCTTAENVCPSCQIGPSNVPEWTDPSCQIGPTNNQRIPENTHEINKDNGFSETDLSTLNQVQDKWESISNHKQNWTDAKKKKILKRVSEYGLENYLGAIDNMANDPWSIKNKQVDINRLIDDRKYESNMVRFMPDNETVTDWSKVKSYEGRY